MGLRSYRISGIRDQFFTFTGYGKLTVKCTIFLRLRFLRVSI